MKEAFLHYIWKNKKLTPLSKLNTVKGETVTIHSVGEYNYNAGPDFFNAQVSIDNQKWAGNVEVHVKSSDWYVHNHENDKAYQNVILHVVWEHDTEVYREDNTAISTLQLKEYINKEVLNNYRTIATKKNKWIYCENNYNTVSEFTLNNWLERLYIERLERKSKEVEAMLEESKNNWEAVLFKILAKNFGLKVNGEAFHSIAQSIPWHVVQKVRTNQQQLEALFYGQAGLLDEDIQEPYFIELKENYSYLRHKFQLNTNGVLPIKFFRLRPFNFPSIRLAQLAALYYSQGQLFSKIIEINNTKQAYKVLDVKVSKFWENHYTFRAKSRKASKKLTKKFLDLLVINTIIPLKFSYAKHKGESNSEKLISLAALIAPEHNSIVDKFNSMKPIGNSALHSQGFIQLKTMYCNKQRCLECAVGNEILNRK